VGTLKLQEKSPEPSAVRLPEVHDEIVIPSNTRDARGVYSEKPDPDTVTGAPTGPEVGATVIAGVVIVNVAADDGVPVATSYPTML
jgi:hypothetical protein